MELESRAYSFKEKREIVQIMGSADAFRSMTDAVYQLKIGLRQNPGLSWGEFEGTLSEDNRRSVILRRVFERYQNARAVSADWAKRYNADHNLVAKRIKEHLAIPEDYTISSVAFNPDSCIVYLPNRQLNSFLGSEGNYDRGGVTAGAFFLEDDKKRQCGIMILSADDPDIVSNHEHEQEHIIFKQYYLRESYGSRHTREVVGSLENHLKRILGSGRTLFLNELIAYGAGGHYMKKSPREVATWFNTVTTGKYGYTANPYGVITRREISKIIDAINQSKMPEDRKLKDWWYTESSLAYHCAQNSLIASWVEQAWNQSGQNIDRFTSALETVPVTRIHTIGHIFGEDPKTLKQQLINVRYDSRDVLWSMLVGLVQTTEGDQGTAGHTRETLDNLITRFYEKITIVQHGLDVETLQDFKHNIIEQYIGTLIGSKQGNGVF